MPPSERLVIVNKTDREIVFGTADVPTSPKPRFVLRPGENTLDARNQRAWARLTPSTVKAWVEAGLVEIRRAPNQEGPQP